MSRSAWFASSFTRHLSLIPAMSLLLGCGGLTESDPVGSTSQGLHSWGDYHWERGDTPLTLAVGDNVSSAWDAYLDEAIVDWNPSEVLELNEVAGPYTTATKMKQCRPTPGRIEVCSGKYGNVGWLGIASIWASGSHITQATAKMNDTYYATAKYNTPGWRRLVMCQEIAHGFGLAHQDEAFDNLNLGSCMDYTDDADGDVTTGELSNEHPNAHDFEQLALIYAHVDGAGSAAASSGSGAADHGGQQIDTGDGSEDVGEAVEHDDRGRPHIFVRHLGDGTTIMTHVFWAP